MRIPALIGVLGLLISGSGMVVPVAAQAAAAADSVGTIQPAIATQPDPESTATISDSMPLCTLDIATEPPGAVLNLDGRKIGASPQVIGGVTVGKHSIIIQKAGFYQKKVMVDISSSGRTELRFQLTAPGKLTIVSDPPGALLTLNGKARGITPFIDSLVKPGTYRFSLVKEQYRTIDDSMLVTSSGNSLYKGVLTVADFNQKSPKRPVATDGTRKNRKTLYVIGGAFVLFLVTLAAIESQEPR